MEKKAGGSDEDEQHGRRGPAQAETEVIDEDGGNKHRGEAQCVALACSALLSSEVVDHSLERRLPGPITQSHS